MFERRRKSTFDRPATEESDTQDSGWDTYFLAPLRKALGLSIERQNAVTTTIARLFMRGRPAAVVRFVVTIIVDAVNAVLARWSRPHILIKHLEGMPAVAHFNSSPTVTEILGTRSTVASPDHAMPDEVFRKRTQAIRSMSLRCFISLKTSTALRVTITKTLPRNCAFHATLASTHPHGASSIAVCGPQYDGQPPERMSGQIYECGVAFGRIGFSHDGTPDTRLVRTARRLQPSGCLHFNRIVLAA